MPPSHGGGSPMLHNFWDPLPMPKRFDLQQPKLVWYQMWSSTFLGGKPRPIPGGPASPKFLRLPTYTNMVWPRATKFGVITRGRVACFCGVSHPRLLSQRDGPSVHKIFRSCLHTVWEAATKFCMFIKLDVRIFYRVDDECWCAICLW